MRRIQRRDFFLLVALVGLGGLLWSFGWAGAVTPTNGRTCTYKEFSQNPKNCCPSGEDCTITCTDSRVGCSVTLPLGAFGAGACSAEGFDPFVGTVTLRDERACSDVDNSDEILDLSLTVNCETRTVRAPPQCSPEPVCNTTLLHCSENQLDDPRNEIFCAEEDCSPLPPPFIWKGKSCVEVPDEDGDGQVDYWVLGALTPFVGVEQCAHPDGCDYSTQTSTPRKITENGGQGKVFIRSRDQGMGVTRGQCKPSAMARIDTAPPTCESRIIFQKEEEKVLVRPVSCADAHSGCQDLEVLKKPPYTQEYSFEELRKKSLLQSNLIVSARAVDRVQSESICEEAELDLRPPASCVTRIFPDEWTNEPVTAELDPDKCDDYWPGCDYDHVVSKKSPSVAAPYVLQDFGARGQVQVYDKLGLGPTVCALSKPVQIDRLPPLVQGVMVKAKDVDISFASEASSAPKLEAKEATILEIQLADQASGIDSFGHQSGTSGVDIRTLEFSILGPNGMRYPSVNMQLISALTTGGMVRLLSVPKRAVLESSQAQTWQVEFAPGFALFSRAGVYELHLRFSDIAGNQSKESLFIKVVASEADQSATVLNLDCGEQPPVANGVDRCAGELLLVDRFGNPAQGHTGIQIKIGKTASGLFQDVARTRFDFFAQNSEQLFLDGLRFVGGHIKGSQHILGGVTADASGKVSFGLVAMAPGLELVSTVFGGASMQLSLPKSWGVPFEVLVPEISPDGTTGSRSQMLSFSEWFQFAPWGGVTIRGGVKGQPQVLGVSGVSQPLLARVIFSPPQPPSGGVRVFLKGKGGKGILLSPKNLMGAGGVELPSLDSSVSGTLSLPVSISSKKEGEPLGSGLGLVFTSLLEYKNPEGAMIFHPGGNLGNTFIDEYGAQTPAFSPSPCTLRAYGCSDEDFITELKSPK